MELGVRCRVVGLIDLRPHTLVTVGEYGTVVRHDRDGTVWIELDTYHFGLSEYRNCIWLMSPDTDEGVLANLEKLEPCLNATKGVIVPLRGTRRRPRNLRASSG